MKEESLPLPVDGWTAKVSAVSSSEELTTDSPSQIESYQTSSGKAIFEQPRLVHPA
jgi:hypothetical protein